MNSWIRFFGLIVLLFLLGCGGGGSNPSSTENEVRGTGAIATSQEDLDLVPLAYIPTGGEGGTHLPNSIDLSSYMPQVGHQGTQNSCVGWAVGYYLKSYQEHIESGNPYGVNANYTNRYSPAFIYNATKIDSCESGANLFKALKLLKTTGAVLWEDMPYNQNYCNQASTDKALEYAKCAKISHFKRFDIHHTHFNSNLKYYLSQSYPIVVAIDLYEGFNKPQKYNDEYFFKEFDKDTKSSNLSHAILIVGYDDTRNAFKVINSWGIGWGNEGYLWIDYEVFQKIVIEAFVVEDELGGCEVESNEIEEISEDVTKKIESSETNKTVDKVALKIDLNITDNITGVAGVTLINRKWVADTITFTFTFSSEVTGFDIDDIIVTNGTKSNFRGSGSSYQLDVIPPIHSTTKVTLSVAPNSAIDSSGIGNEQATANQEINTVKAFITVWDTTKIGVTEDNQITIPTTGEGYNYHVDWGDGTMSTNLTETTVHTYSSAGIYTVKITGTFPQIYMNDKHYLGSGYTDSHKLIYLQQWGTIQWRSMESAFTGCKNMRSNTQDIPNLSDVSNMSAMFYYAELFNDENIQYWDVSHVTDMSELFTFAQSFNQDISSWNVSSVTTMSRMFWGAEIFNQPLNSWDISSVTNMSAIFGYNTIFNQPLASWDVSNVTNMHQMFRHGKFNQDISNWDVSNVTNMREMFVSSVFNKDISSWNVSNVTNMKYMFQGAVFNQPLNNWDVSNVTDMSGMFWNAEEFNQDISSWDVSSVIDTSLMFYNAKSFNKPLDNWNVSSVTTMRWMFSGTDSFNQPLNNWNVSSATNMEGMFHNAIAFNQPLNSWDVSNVILMGHLVGDIQDYGMFENAISFNQDLSSWNFSSVQYMDDMLKNTNFSTTNYNNLLVKLAQSSLEENVTIGLGSIQYSPDYADERQYIIDTFGWTIEDGGVASE